jgi:hypothetical protein
MSRSLLAASWFAVRRAGLLVPAGAALLLIAGTVHVQDDGHAAQVLRGVAILLTCAWVASMDDPAGEVVAASPYPRHVRSLARVTAAASVVLPVWLLAAVVAEVRYDPVPVAGLTLEATALCLSGLAIGAGLRAYGHLTPSHLAVVGVVALVILTHALPRSLTMVQSQTWGPPWEAAQLRWAGLLLVGVGALAVALRDPVPGSPGLVGTLWTTSGRYRRFITVARPDSPVLVSGDGRAERHRWSRRAPTHAARRRGGSRAA